MQEPRTQILDRVRKLFYCAAILLIAGALAGASHGDKSLGPSRAAQMECKFSDGGAITFGRASGAARSGADSWRVGDYEATTFRVTERMVIPPMDSPIEIPVGSYTLFVMDKPKDRPDRWTLVISRKTGEWGMPYPGEQYDLGRTHMGSDLRPPVENFIIGCTQHQSGPIFLWMQSGRYVAYAKIMAEKITNGKTEFFVH
ncbi:MAG: DUF2911 domain-containing protein [Terriglobales bacterium]